MEVASDRFRRIASLVSLQSSPLLDAHQKTRARNDLLRVHRRILGEHDSKIADDTRGRLCRQLGRDHSAGPMSAFGMKGRTARGAL